MLTLDNSNRNTENLPASPLSAALWEPGPAPSVTVTDCGTAQLFAVPFGGRAGLPPRSTPSCSGAEGVSRDGSRGLPRAAATGVFPRDTSAQVFACKLGVRSGHSLQFQMPFQVVLRGCWSCV